MKNESTDEQHWWRGIKIKNLPVQLCSENKDHKFIEVTPGQKKCPYCLKGKEYPPPKPANWFADWEDNSELLPKEILDW